MKYNTVEDIRKEFKSLYQWGKFSKNTVEIQCASFIADEPTILGGINEDYITAEIEWYESQSLSVQTLFDIYGQEVKIWKDVADDSGFINSNYGWCIYSNANGSQYNTVMHNLWNNPDTRHAVMYYTRPTIHKEAGKDHICTLAVQYHLNSNVLDAHVYMRSNDAVYGFNNDLAWQRHVLQKLSNDLSHAHNHVRMGKIIWNASSLHVYPRHYHLLEE